MLKSSNFWITKCSVIVFKVVKLFRIVFKICLKSNINNNGRVESQGVLLQRKCLQSGQSGSKLGTASSFSLRFARYFDTLNV